MLNRGLSYYYYVIANTSVEHNTNVCQRVKLQTIYK